MNALSDMSTINQAEPLTIDSPKTQKNTISHEEDTNSLNLSIKSPSASTNQNETVVKIISQIKSASQIEKMTIEPIQFLIEDILPESGLIILSGSPKIGKTNLMTYLSLCLAEGLPVFGSIPIPKRNNVLFLALEENDQRMNFRIERFYSNTFFNEAWTENFNYLLSFPNMKEDGLFYLEQVIENTNPDIIVIDTLERFIARGGRESYSGDSQILSRLHAFVQKYKKAFIFLHHNRKLISQNEVDLISGTYGISGGFDNLWIMVKENNQIILVTEGRDIPSEKYKLDYDHSTFIWTITGKLYEIARSKEQNDVIDLLKQHGKPMHPKEIAKLLEINEGTARTRLSRMTQANQLCNTKEGYTLSNNQ